MAGVSFEDDNLALAVLGHLTQAGVVPPFDKAAWRAAHPTAEDPDRLDAIDWRGAEDDLESPADEEAADPDEDYRDHFGSRDLRAALTLVPLDPAAVAGIEHLRWGAWSDAAIRHVVWTYWDGEDDTFDIASLQGIGQLEGLKHLDLEMCAEDLDLAPLVGHPSLETLTLNRRVANLAPLLGVPRLQRASIPGVGRPEHASTVAALRAKGVACE